MTIAAHRIALDPTQEQANCFARACGTARFAYNWALAEWNRMREAGEKPNWLLISRKLNAVKGNLYPWMKDVSKFAPATATQHLGVAFERYFAYRKAMKIWMAGGRAGKRPRKTACPRFKKKGTARDSYTAVDGPKKAGTDAAKIVNRRIQIPVVGWVRMRQSLRFSGQIKRVTISRTADRWFASVLVDTPDIKPVPAKTKRPVVGVDLGVRTLATLSTGEKVEGPKAMRTLMPKLRRASRSVGRKVKGSANRRKAVRKLARLHYRIACVRNDATHKLTTRLAKGFRVVGIEDLNVRGMLRGNIARGVTDAAFGEFRRQLAYKCEWYGAQLVVSDRFFPSTKTCPDCGTVNDGIDRRTTFWVCPSCQAWHDRDVAAAVNLERYAARSAASACGGEGSGPTRKSRTKPAPAKQEAP
jgi:putative transposase